MSMSNRAAQIPATANGFETVIGASLVVEGQITSTGSVRVNGTITGPLKGSDRVSIATAAKVIGDITAPTVEIAGHVEGHVNAGSVLLTRGAVVNGNITAPVIKMEEGASVEGSLIMNTPFVMPNIEAAARTETATKA